MVPFAQASEVWLVLSSGIGLPAAILLLKLVAEEGSYGTMCPSKYESPGSMKRKSDGSMWGDP